MSLTHEAKRLDHSQDLIPDDHVIVLFGATGDLARRKLLPGLFHLSQAGLLPARVRIVGTSRAPLSDDEFRMVARDAVYEFARRTPTEEAWLRSPTPSRMRPAATAMRCVPPSSTRSA